MRLHLRPVKDVGIKRVRQVVPEIREVKLEEAGEKELVAGLGTLQHDAPRRYLLDLSLPPRPDGKYAVAQLELSYDLGTGRRESSGPVALEVAYTAEGQGYANAEVMRHVDEARLKERNDDLQRALQGNDQQADRQVAQDIVKIGEGLGQGAARRTRLAKEILQELNDLSTVRRKTQLAMDDAARTPELPS